LLFKSKKNKALFNKKQVRKNDAKVNWQTPLLKKDGYEKKKFKNKKFRLKKKFILRISKPWRRKKKQQNFVNRFVKNHLGRRHFSKTKAF